MRRWQSFVAFLASAASAAAYTNCSGFAVSPSVGAGFRDAVYSTATPLPIQGDEAYVMPITMGCSYVNEPCVTIAICSPGTATCKTITNVLLDTGSYGLRVFSSLVPELGLQQIRDASNRPVAECYPFGGGASDWGPIVRADVRLGGLTASNIPIQLIDSEFASRPASCTNPDTTPEAVGFNAILGVGALTRDCFSPDCVSGDALSYWSCAAGDSSCAGPIAVETVNQTANPVAMLPTNNNGLAVQMPAIPETGAGAVSGYAIMGIGTQERNSPPPGTVVLPLDRYGTLSAEFDGLEAYSFIDSGTWAISLPSKAGMASCPAPNEDLLCPAVPTTLTATNIGEGGTPRSPILFRIRSAYALLSATSNLSFNSLGMASSALIEGMEGDLGWGMPFYFGRTVYVVFAGRPSPLGTGPLNAY